MDAKKSALCVIPSKSLTSEPQDVSGKQSNSVALEKLHVRAHSSSKSRGDDRNVSTNVTKSKNVPSVAVNNVQKGDGGRLTARDINKVINDHRLSTNQAKVE